MLVKVQPTNIGKRTYDYGKIHTVKEVVHLLKISKQTAQRVINTAVIKPDKRDNNQCRFYSYRKMMKIVKLSTPGFERRNVAQQTETSRQTSGNNLVQSMASIESIKFGFDNAFTKADTEMNILVNK